MLYTPNHPSDLQNTPPPAPNIVLRIHSAWTDIGQQMLGDPSQQDQAAQSWCQAINSFASTKSQVYVEPFNELSHPSECRSPSGTLDIDTAISKAHSFISKLQSCLDSSATIISPALDPQNANFPKTSQAFSNFSIISYHPYQENTAKNYSSGPLAGKQFIFTETGTTKNGQVIYDDCALIDFYCGLDITPFWQDQSDIIAYFLFTFSPGDYGGSWTLTSPSVVKALTAQCDEDLPCQPQDIDCRLESLYTPPINIKTADPSHPGIAKPRWDGGKHPNNYAPKQELVTICVSDTEIKQTFSPLQNPDTKEIEPYTATEVRENVKENKFASNLPRLVSRFFKPITLLFSKEQITESFTSFGDNYISASYKMTPAKQQNKFRQHLIAKAKSGTALDEQIAWTCSTGCFGLNCGKPDNSCQPIYLSDDTQPCHQLAYPYINFTRSGSSNSQVIVTDDNGQTTQDRMLPNGAVLAESNVPLQAISSNQKKASNEICKTVARPPIQDTTNLLKFNLFRFISELINKIKTVKTNVKIEEKIDSELLQGLENQKTLVKNFLPERDNQKTQNEADSGTTGKINIKSPGGGQPEKDFRNFIDYLHPASWNL